MELTRLYAAHIIRESIVSRQRTGQWLFNDLPPDAGRVVVGTNFDPFQENLSEYELISWLKNHAVVGDLRVLAIIDGEDILWEEKVEVLGPNDLIAPGAIHETVVPFTFRGVQIGIARVREDGTAEVTIDDSPETEQIRKVLFGTSVVKGSISIGET